YRGGTDCEGDIPSWPAGNSPRITTTTIWAGSLKYGNTRIAWVSEWTLPSSLSWPGDRFLGHDAEPRAVGTGRIKGAAISWHASSDGHGKFIDCGFADLRPAGERGELARGGARRRAGHAAPEISPPGQQCSRSFGRGGVQNGVQNPCKKPENL